MAPTVRLAPRAALERLPVPDALLRFLAEQGLDWRTCGTRCTRTRRALSARAASGRRPRSSRWVSAGGGSFDPGGERVLLVDHRLRVTRGPVALAEAWLAEQHGIDPAGDDGDGLRVAASLDGGPAGAGGTWEVLAAEQRVLEQALTPRTSPAS